MTPAWMSSSDFTVSQSKGQVTVDFGSYARTHPGKYYIVYEYEENNYYTWHRQDDGTTSYTFDTVPGKTIHIGVYWMADTTEPPGRVAYSKTLTLAGTGAYSGNGFRETEHYPMIYNSGTIEKVRAFGLEDANSDDVKKEIGFYWYYNVSESTSVKCLGVLYAPDGQLYFQSTSYTFKPQKNSGSIYRWDLLNDQLSKYSRLSGSIQEGKYRFELYFEGQLADQTEFTIGQKTVKVN